MRLVSDIPSGDRVQDPDQRGFTLYEVLVALMLVGLVVGALTAGVLSALRTSATANASARSSVLLTSFEETLIQLDYRPCTEGDLEGLYEQDFEDADARLPPQRQILVDGRDVQADIVSVDSGCSGGVTADDGEQELRIELTYQGRTRAGNVVKRDPQPPDRLATAKFEVEALTGKVAGQPLRSEGELKGIFRLDPTSSFAPAPIEEYQWDCNAGDNPNGPSGGPVVKTSADPFHECVYNAEASDQSYEIVLTIRDQLGNTNTSAATTVTVGPAAQPIIDPVATIRAYCPSIGCNGGEAPLTVNFKGSGNVPGGRTIASYEWDFGDPGSGSANSSTQKEPSHTFSPPGSGSTTYQIRLWVTDNNGNRSAAASYTIDVTVPADPIPTASFTMSPSPLVLAPQTVSFDASGSSSASGGPLSYSWDFGDNVGGSGEETSHEYTSTGTRTVTLTVTDSNNQTHSTSKVLEVAAFSLPTNFRHTSTSASYNVGHIYFSWTNPPGSSADRYEYDIQIEASNVLCTLFGTETRTVRNSVPGTFQTYDFRVDGGYGLFGIPLPAWVCPGQVYTYRLTEMRRMAPDGTEVDSLGPLPGVRAPI